MLTRHREPRSETIGLLDIGSSKVCCLIVARAITPAQTALADVRILGIGHQRSRGIKAGYVSDMDQAEAVVRTAISQAEEQAGVTLEDIVVNVTCGRMRSVHFMAHADLEAGCVRPDDLTRLSKGAYAYAERDGRTVVHMNRIAYLLDGVSGVRQPLRMAGRRLSAQYHAVTVDEPALQNLLVLIGRTFLNVRQFVPTGFASALAALTEEERRFGAICVDIGSGTTNVSLVAEDRFQCAEVLPFGSGILTYDIAKALAAPLAEAERIKTLYGTMIPAGSDDQQPIGYTLAGDDDEHGDTTRAELRRIIYPRMLSQLNLLRERIEASDLLNGADFSVVLTGGASQLLGLPAVAADVLQRPVRLGRTRLAPGMPEVLRSPAFACATGLAQVAAVEGSDRSRRDGGHAEMDESYFGRVRSWLSESF
jgi:cell division protein FtsA